MKQREKEGEKEGRKERNRQGEKEKKKERKGGKEERRKEGGKGRRKEEGRLPVINTAQLQNLKACSKLFTCSLNHTSAESVAKLGRKTRSGPGFFFS